MGVNSATNTTKFMFLINGTNGTMGIIDWVVGIDTPLLTRSRVIEEMHLVYHCTNLINPTIQIW